MAQNVREGRIKNKKIKKKSMTCYQFSTSKEDPQGIKKIIFKEKNPR